MKRTHSMRQRWLVLALASGLVFSWSTAWAASVQICIKATNTCKSVQNFAPLEDANIKIDNYPGQTAQVWADDSASNDKLALKGAKITFKNTVTDYEIEITGTGYNGPPNLPAGPNYRLTATSQTFMRGAAGAYPNVVKATGSVRPSGGAWNQVGTQLVKFIYVNSYSFFNGSYLDEAISNGTNVSRDLKINLFLTATNTSDVANFPNAGLELKNTTSPGGGPGAGDPSDCDGCQGVAPPTPPCTKSSMLSSTCATTYNTMKMSGCPTCITDDQAMKQAQQIRLFVDNNWDDLQQDMARGDGEHLTALASLMRVPEGEQKLFCALANESFRAHSEEDVLTPAKLIADLREKLKQDPRMGGKTDG